MEFVLLAFVLVVFIIFAILLIKKNRNKKKEIEYFKTQLHKIIRNEALDKAINNYQKKGDRNYWLLKAVEINRFGEKEHFFNLEKNVSIGKEFQSNDFFVLDEDADMIQCQVSMIKEVPYIVNCSKNVPIFFSYKTKAKRNVSKNHQMNFGESIRLYTGDSVQFGETKIVFYVYNYNRGLV